MPIAFKCKETSCHFCDQIWEAQRNKHKFYTKTYFPKIPKISLKLACLLFDLCFFPNSSSYAEGPRIVPPGCFLRSDIFCIFIHKLRIESRISPFAGANQIRATRLVVWFLVMNETHEINQDSISSSSWSEWLWTLQCVKLRRKPEKCGNQT